MREHQLMTIREVADHLRVDRTTVWRWCAAGKLSAFKAGHSWRIYRAAVDHLIKTGLPFEPAEPDSEDSIGERIR